jgi:cytochrome oxidase assembly protein ShyY1
MNAGLTGKQAVDRDPGPVSQRFGWRGFRPGVPMTLFVVIMLPTLIALGRWQLDRAVQKDEAYALAEAARTEAPLSMSGYRALTESTRAYRTLTLPGRFDPERLMLLDNQIHAGQVGYWIMQLFQVENRSEQFLVNRGFIAAPQRRDIWPQVETPDSVVVISGLLWPQLGLLPLFEDAAVLESAPGSTGGWPRRIQRIDFETFARWLPGLEAMELRLVDGSNALMSVAAPTELPNGAPRHRGYALQWFGLATVLMIGFVVFGRINARDSLLDSASDRRRERTGTLAPEAAPGAKQDSRN